MSPPNEHIRTEARLCADVANAALRAATAFDPIACGIGVADMSVAVAGDNEIAKVMLAKHLLKLARELEPKLPFAVRGWH